MARPFTVLAAVPTPLSPDGRAVDLDALGTLVSHLASHGVGVVTATPGAGEGRLLSSSERAWVAAAAVSAAAGRVPVWAGGIEAAGTASVLASVQALASTGVEAVVVPPPRVGAVGGAPRPGELRRYVERVLESGCPVVLADDPGDAGYSLVPEPLRSLTLSRLVGVLLPGDDPATVRRWAAAAPVYVTSPAAVFGAWVEGALGFVGAAAAFLSPFPGSVADAEAVRRLAVSLAGSASGDEAPAVKAAWARGGRPVGPPRRPWLAADLGDQPEPRPVRTVAAEAVTATPRPDAAVAFPVACMSITPFDDDGRLDEAAVARHVDRLAAGGVAVYLGSFGTGEGHLLEPDEILRLYAAGVAAAAGRVPVYAAALGFQATDTVIELAAAAAATGVTAVQIHPPRPGDRGARPTLAELDRYYADVLGAVRSPVRLTNQVAMTGFRLPAAYVGDLVADHPQVVGVNHTDPDAACLAPAVAAIAGRAAVSVGMVAQVPLLMALAPTTGGALCFEPNVAPALCLAAITALRDGDATAIAASYGRWRRLHEALLRYQNPRSVKSAMDILGLHGGPVREPILPLPADEVASLATALADLGVEPLAR